MLGATVRSTQKTDKDLEKRFASELKLIRTLYLLMECLGGGVKSAAGAEVLIYFSLTLFRLSDAVLPSISSAVFSQQNLSLRILGIDKRGMCGNEKLVPCLLFKQGWQ